MTLCINDSGVWREISTNCINDSGVWREVATGCINDSGTWRCYGFYNLANCSLGDNVEGGYLIKKDSGTAYIVAPSSTETQTYWGNRNAAVTAANAQAACGDWFIPTCDQLRNIGYDCRSYWDGYTSSPAADSIHWSNEAAPAGYGGYWAVYMSSGANTSSGNHPSICHKVRAFRTVSY